MLLAVVMLGCQNPDGTTTPSTQQLPTEAVIEIKKLNELEWYQSLKRDGYCWCMWFGDTPVAMGRCEGGIISPQTANIICPPKPQ